MVVLVTGPAAAVSRAMPLVISVCVPAAGSTSNSRSAASASAPVMDRVRRTDGTPTMVPGDGGANVHAATPASDPSGRVRQPALATGSRAVASGPSPELALVAIGVVVVNVQVPV